MSVIIVQKQSFQIKTFTVSFVFGRAGFTVGRRKMNFVLCLYSPFGFGKECDKLSVGTLETGLREKKGVQAG